MKRLLLALCLLIPAAAGGSQIVNPAASGGGGGGSGSTVYPATGTAAFPFGMSVSSINMTGGAITGLSNGTTTSMAVNYLQLSNVANANLLLNGNFAYWQRGTTFTGISNSSGTVQLFDNWSAIAPNVTITVARNTATVHQAHYSADVTFGNVNVGNGTTVIQQSVLNYYDVLGTTVTFSFWENSNTGQVMNAIIADSVGTSTGTACTEDATWRLCSVTRFVSSAATSLTVKIGFTFSNISFNHTYLDGAMLVFGTEAIPYLPPAGPLDAAKDQFDGINLGSVGALTNSNAATGNVGEYLESVVANVNAAASGSFGDMTSVAFTPGDWDVTGTCYLHGFASGTVFQIGISPTSGNSTTGLVLGVNRFVDDLTSGNSAEHSMWIPVYRISLAATTTYYLKEAITWGSGTAQGDCRLSGRRVR